MSRPLGGSYEQVSASALENLSPLGEAGALPLIQRSGNGSC